jgi:hypothetical protein
MDSKRCSKCKIEKSIDEFYNDKKRSDGSRAKIAACKDCTKAKNRKWMDSNKERHRKTSIEWKKKNKEYTSEWHRAHYQKEKEHYKYNQKKYYEANKERVLKRNKEYDKRNKNTLNLKRREYETARRKTDPIHKTKLLLRNQSKRLLKYKYDKTIKLVGMSPLEFYEANGSPDLNDINIDHIVPLSWFNLEDKNHVKVSTHHTNLQFLSSSDNKSKGSNYAGSPTNIIAYKDDFDIQKHVDLIIKEHFK